MSGDAPNGPGSLASRVAAELLESNAESAEYRRLMESNELRTAGLARVIGRPGVAFVAEHAEQVADVIEEAGIIANRRGASLLGRAESIRRAAKG